MDTARLIVPHWYGAGDERIGEGCQILQRTLAAGDAKVIAAVEADVVSKHGVRDYERVLASQRAIRQAVEELRPGAIYALGGDCGIEVPIVSYLSRLYENNIAVVWIDAHADANTPQSSPSGLFHGMPVRCLCGEGDQDICATAFSIVPCGSFAYFGTRQFDSDEAGWISQHEIPVTDTAADLLRALRIGNRKFAYIHVDLDVLEPSEFAHVACPTCGGRTIVEIASVLEAISHEFQIVGATFVECTARTSEDLKPIQPLLQWWNNTSGATGT
jgi:arginase